MTPGPYFHIGGDEVKTLTPAQYKAFVERVQTIVQKHGKQMIGWDEIAAATLLPTSIVQHWRPDAAHGGAGARAAPDPVARRSRVPRHEVRPRRRRSGLNWAGLIPVQTRVRLGSGRRSCPGAAPDAILGVEAPLWSETIANMRDVEFLAMPRLAADRRSGWSPARAPRLGAASGSVSARRGRAGRRSASTSIARPRCRGSSPASRPTTWDASPSASRRRRRCCAAPDTRCTVVDLTRTKLPEEAVRTGGARGVLPADAHGDAARAAGDRPRAAR